MNDFIIHHDDLSVVAGTVLRSDRVMSVVMKTDEVELLHLGVKPAVMYAPII